MTRTQLTRIAPLAAVGLLGLLTCLVGACVSESDGVGLGADDITGYGSSGYGYGYGSSGYTSSGHAPTHGTSTSGHY